MGRLDLEVEGGPGWWARTSGQGRARVPGREGLPVIEVLVPRGPYSGGRGGPGRARRVDRPRGTRPGSGPRLPGRSTRGRNFCFLLGVEVGLGREARGRERKTRRTRSGACRGWSASSLEARTRSRNSKAQKAPGTTFLTTPRLTTSTHSRGRREEVPVRTSQAASSPAARARSMPGPGSRRGLRKRQEALAGEVGVVAREAPQLLVGDPERAPEAEELEPAGLLEGGRQVLARALRRRREARRARGPRWRGSGSRGGARGASGRPG